MKNMSFLKTVEDPSKIITPIDSTIRFPEVMDNLIAKYTKYIDIFCELVKSSETSYEILDSIRSSSRDKEERMALLKMFRRCVSPVLDTETTKKIIKVKTETLIQAYGHTFKSIDKLKNQFSNLPVEQKYALAALIGEYDTRGQLGYQLTGLFFDWFESHFHGQYIIEGPRGAGPDIELSQIYPEFSGSFPCDFVIRKIHTGEVLAVGFARYDSTRGGAQSDDRTGGNANKVDKIIAFDKSKKTRLKLIFLSDGPGLMHTDTWKESCDLDGLWGGRVRVVTLKIAERRITPEWLES